MTPEDSLDPFHSCQHQGPVLPESPVAVGITKPRCNSPYQLVTTGTELWATPLKSPNLRFLLFTIQKLFCWNLWMKLTPCKDEKFFTLTYLLRQLHPCLLFSIKWHFHSQMNSTPASTPQHLASRCLCRLDDVMSTEKRAIIFPRGTTSL